MRKISSIFILSIYLLLSVGIAKSTHFCMGRKHHSSLFSFESKKCACYIYQSTKTCCEDETELVKIENDQVHSSLVDLPPTDFNLLAVFNNELSPIEPLATTRQIVSYDLPPPKIPIYQLGCSWKVDDLMM